MILLHNALTNSVPRFSFYHSHKQHDLGLHTFIDQLYMQVKTVMFEPIPVIMHSGH